jgi:hypothetical protein
MFGFEMISSRAASRRAILVGIAGMAATVILLDRIVEAAADSETTQSGLRQRGKSRPSVSTRVNEAERSPQPFAKRVGLSLPAYLPLE